MHGFRGTHFNDFEKHSPRCVMCHHVSTGPSHSLQTSSQFFFIYFFIITIISIPNNILIRIGTPQNYNFVYFF